MGGTVLEKFDSFLSRMDRPKKLSHEEERSSLDFFMRNNVPEDVNFNPKRNRAIIARTIKKNEAVAKKRKQQFKDGLGEKIDMVASFMKAKDSGGKGATSIGGYLGKRWMAKLRGEQIVQQLQNALTVRDGLGRIVKKPREVTIRH